MKRSSHFLFLSLFWLVVCLQGQSGAAECKPRAIIDTKPRLTGRVEDQTKRLALEWHSAAGKSKQSGTWIIDNAICNVGEVPLILDWQKADLSNDGYSPLSPGLEIYNTFTLGSAEPISGSAQLDYGTYAKSQTQTQIYGAPEQKKMGAVMESVLGGSFRASNAVPTSEPRLQTANFVVSIEVINKGDGYVFVADVKSEPRAEFRIAISSSQNELFSEALAKAGVRNTGVAPLRKITKVSDNSGLKRFADRPFVFMPLSNPVQVYIPTKVSSDIETAPVVVIRNDLTPVALGKISLFR
jgi:hypothetical protein